MNVQEVSFGKSEGRLLADTASVAEFESDVAELAPSVSPGVLEPPGFGVHSDQQDVVVHVSAGAAIVDSRSVGLPVGGIDCHGKRALGKGTLDIIASAEFNVLVDGLVLSSLLLAGVLDSLVRVGGESGQSLISDVGERAISASTLAAEGGVAGRAIHDLLFGKLDVLILEQVETFDETGRAKGISGITLALVANCAHFSQGLPVDLLQDGGKGIGSHIFRFNMGLVKPVGEHGFEFGLAEVGELVDSLLVGLALIGVVSLDLLQVMDEDEASEGLLLIGEGKAEVSHPLLECLLMGQGGGGVEVEGDCCEKQQCGDLPALHDKIF